MFRPIIQREKERWRDKEIETIEYSEVNCLRVILLMMLV